MRPQSLTLITEHPVIKTNIRVSAIDIVRGLIMALMALAHCQEYICASQNHPLDWDEPSRWLFNSYFEFFQHAFISMTASGGFFMMMGIGIVLLWHAREKEGWAHLTSKRVLLTSTQASKELFKLVKQRLIEFV